jgi:phosphoribosylformylglycinamidine cyclo-ligase
MKTPRSRKSTKPLSYERAGVSIDAGDALVDRLRAANAGIGGFSGLFPLETKGMRNPMLVASTDGVGTKLLLAREAKALGTIGQDLVGMVVNDLLVCGARPLFFLDYYATGNLNVDEADAVIGGIRRACDDCGMELIGGETAEMPGVYKPGDFDLAGFGVGIVDRSKVIDGSGVKPGDVLVGVASSGVHSNGFSLVRAILERKRARLSRHVPQLGTTLGEALLAPTRLYARAVKKVLKRVTPRAMAHITGGGLPGNLVRVLPDDAGAVIDGKSWQVPALFQLLQKWGDVDTDEMFRVFNMGIGYVFVMRAKDAKGCCEVLRRAGEDATIIGEIVKGERRVDIIQ